MTVQKLCVHCFVVCSCGLVCSRSLVCVPTGCGGVFIIVCGVFICCVFSCSCFASLLRWGFHCGRRAPLQPLPSPFRPDFFALCALAQHSLKIVYFRGAFVANTRRTPHRILPSMHSLEKFSPAWGVSGVTLSSFSRMRGTRLFIFCGFLF